MDFPTGSPAPRSSSAPVIDVPAELRVLRLAVSLMLVALIISSGSLGVYLFRQVTLLRRQVDNASRLAAQSYQNYKEQVEPRAVAFERQLKDFARTNADFQLRIARYFPEGFEASGTPGSPGTPPPQNPSAPVTPRGQ